MDSRKPLYRHSLKEAVRHEEKDLWRESYKINCDCARAIERIIAENYDGKKLGPDLAEPIIEQYGFNRVNWVLANTVPVSYTHLDVYKRQVFWYLRKNFGSI